MQNPLWHGFILGIKDRVNRRHKTIIMKKIALFSLVALLVSLSSCELIGDIFEAGVWAGVLLVVGIIGVVVFLISRLFGGR